MKNQKDFNRNYPYRMSGENGRTSVFLYGEIGEGKKADPLSVVGAIMELKPGEDAELHINSNGGDVFGGISIYNALKNSPANISIHIDGVAASMAGIIALCGKPLYMGMYSRIMLHHVSGGAYGGVKELSEAITQMKALEDDLSNILAKRCRMKPEEVRNRYFDGENHWLTAQQALSLGFIDGIRSDEEISANEDTPEGIYNAMNSKFEARFHMSAPENLNVRIKKIPAFNGMDDDSILEYIKNIKPLTVDNVLDNALAKGIISNVEKEEMSVAYKNNLSLLQKTLENREKMYDKSFEALYMNVLKEANNYTILQDKDFINGDLKRMAKSNFKAFKKLMLGKRSLLVKDFICLDESKIPEGREGWTLADYRKKAPNELRRNPELYNRLLNSENR